MSDDKSVEIDPRFDPAFQRGFDQTIPIDEYVPDPLPRKVAAPATAVPAGPVPAAPVPAAPVSPPRVLAPVPPVPPRAAATAAALDEPVPDVDDRVTLEADDELDSNPSRNPFLLFLVVIAIALIAAGIWVFIRSGEAFNSSEVRSQGDYMSLTATIQMAPFVALLGAATAIGVLFVFASRWHKRR
jgi:uncharacterized membrane protein YidH (DUF202 family)